MSNLSQRAACGVELAATMTGSAVKIGTLLENPVQIIFDNQGTASVAIYYNGTAAGNLWRTFPAGEALVLDMRAAAYPSNNFTFSIGDTFYGLGASGVFSISFTYAYN